MGEEENSVGGDGIKCLILWSESHMTCRQANRKEPDTKKETFSNLQVLLLRLKWSGLSLGGVCRDKLEVLGCQQKVDDGDR